MCPLKCLKESIPMRFFFQSINDGLTELIPIYSVVNENLLALSVVKQKYVDAT